MSASHCILADSGSSCLGWLYLSEDVEAHSRASTDKKALKHWSGGINEEDNESYMRDTLTNLQSLTCGTHGNNPA